jgi:hypothetical protein
MQVVYEMAPVIADIIAAHCPGTRARHDFVHACLIGDWEDTKSMIEGMLAEPWHLRGHQESRLREFLELVQLQEGALVRQ